MASHIRDYEDLEGIGTGSSGTIWQATERSTKRRVTLKKLCKEQPQWRIDSEVEAVTSLRGIPGVPYFHGKIDDLETWLVFDYIDGVDLFSWLENRKFKAVSEDHLRYISLQLLRTVCHIHEAGVAHKDIKLENLIYNPITHAVTLIDFGLAHFLEDGGCLDFAGSMEYCPPEMLVSMDPFSATKVDVWGMGVTLYALRFGIFPFAFTSSDLQLMMREGVHPNVQFPDNVQASVELKDLLSRMMDVDPARRIAVEEVILHPWFDYNEPGDS